MPADPRPDAPEVPPSVLEALERLLAVVHRLRAPGGCPWDRAQTTVSLGPYLLEEAFETVDALASGDLEAVREELGDVLVNVLMIARIAEEAGQFGLAAVAEATREKLVRRHPHVFGQAAAADAATALAHWERQKRAEGRDGPRGALAGVPQALPALLRARRVGEKAARVGFDWPDARGPRAKIDEELRELDEALAAADRAAAEAELGDLLFSVVNLARHHGLDAETALRATVERFTARFAHVEQALGDALGRAPLAELEAAWQAAKRTVGAPTDRRQPDVSAPPAAGDAGGTDA